MLLSKIKRLAFLTLAAVSVSVFSFTAYASLGVEPVTASTSTPISVQQIETMIVTAAWIDDDMLRINVTDKETGINSALAVRLSDYISVTDNSPYILIQAVDFDGKKSGVIQIKNPYYDSSRDSDNSKDVGQVHELVTPEVIITPDVEETDGSLPTGKPFTPDGSGSVIDNVTENDGKEFFTIFTEDGNEFFLIIDRQRNSDNVYLLNTVKEEDLLSLAAKRDGGTYTAPSTIPTPISPTNPSEVTVEPTPTPTAQPEPETKKPQANNNSNYILIGVVALVVGGAGYYFKIVKGKKASTNFEEDEDDFDEPDDADDDFGDLDDGDIFGDAYGVDDLEEEASEGSGGR